MENQLKFRSAGLTNAVGSFPMGLVLIEKERTGNGEYSKGPHGCTNSSIMSDDILLFARREAARIRHMSKDQSQFQIPYPAARRKSEAISPSRTSQQRLIATQTDRPRSTKSVTINRPAKSTSSNLTAKRSTLSLRRFV